MYIVFNYTYNEGVQRRFTRENKMVRRVTTRIEKYGTESGEEMDRATCCRKIISHTGNPTRWEKTREKERKKKRGSTSILEKRVVPYLLRTPVDDPCSVPHDRW